MYSSLSDPVFKMVFYLRKLRLGHYDIEARLDLHRFTVAEAPESSYGHFLKRRARLGLRTLLTHGKGLGNKERSGSGRA